MKQDKNCNYFEDYNNKRPHQSLNYATPVTIYKNVA
ncbi:integrase core domain-containing protein [Bacteroidales bacterium OttesenSCG-928-K03]|nr:integrase core domain-containing protein [Odoribacter sp. OttesenSCG-928-L07]MDL2238783.1 integrase core domain-containing protein [Bacteroidales bacterium OttesenSCG-928-L14]MDL2243112.1 integrase core domain-containing protein [Bacteroidales bacterium OttesenSCG-928-K03]